MQFSGNQLLAILSNQVEALAVYDAQSFTRGEVEPANALVLAASGSFFGIGNKKRIKAIRPVTTIFRSNSSRTTRPVRAGADNFRIGDGQLMGNSRTLHEHCLVTYDGKKS